MASRNASRTVMVTISVPSGRSGSGGVGSGGGAAGCGFAGGGALLACGAVCWALAGGAVTGAFCWRVAPPAWVNAEASSPSPKIMAIGVLTATSLVPSGTKILPRVPSSTASTSIVALSVSISAMTSPDLTLSPSFLCHFARLPFSMVGESAGISTSIGMGVFQSRQLWPRLTCLLVNVPKKLGGVGLGIICRKFSSLVDHRPRLGVYLFQRVFSRVSSFENPTTHLLDWIVLSAHFIHFFLAAVFCRVGHGMAAISIREHFENDRPITPATPLHGFVGRRFDCTHVHAIDPLARNFKRSAAPEQLGRRRGARNGGPHPVLIVLDDVNDRQLPQLCHVE